MASLQRRLLMERTEAERLRMGCAMFDAARALMRAGLGDATGTDRSAALRVRLFEQTYGSDFDATTAARIIAHLRDTTAAAPNRQGMPEPPLPEPTHARMARRSAVAPGRRFRHAR
jgi:hypothetical protein